MAIENLTRTTAITSADDIPLRSATGGDDQKASVSALAAYLEGAMTLPATTLAVQHAAPSATGFAVAVSAGNTWLIITPTGGFAAGTVTLPATKADQDIVQVNCTQSVTTLTVSGNGSTVTGAPTTLAANAFFTLRWDAVNASWYRVG